MQLAETVLLRECMARAGFVLHEPTAEELIEMIGGWSPHPVLGIGSEGAARRIGYHLPEVGGRGTASQTAAFSALSDVEAEAYIEALTGGDSAPVAEVVPVDGSAPSGVRQAGGCWVVAESQLGDYVNGTIAYQSVTSRGQSLDRAGRVSAEPEVAAALEQWGACVDEAVGETAPTPNELARRYAFEDGPATDKEKEVAVADARCQAQAQLGEAYAVAKTRLFRAALGDEVDFFDDYTRMRVEVVAIAEQLLSDRDIEPPALD